MKKVFIILFINFGLFTISSSVHADSTFEELMTSLQEERFQQQLPREGLAEKVNMARLDSFIARFKEEIQSDEFQNSFPHSQLSFSQPWWDNIKTLCLTNHELDFANKTFHPAYIYDAVKEENQLAFDVGCSIIVQVFSQLLLDMKINDDYPDITIFLDEIAKFRYLMQDVVLPHANDTTYFYRRGKEEEVILDPITVDTPERLVYLKKLKSQSDIKRFSGGYKKVVGKHSKAMGCTIIKGSVIFNNKTINCKLKLGQNVATVHFPQQYQEKCEDQPLLDLYNKVIATSDFETETKKIAFMKEMFLTFTYNFSNSSTYFRGQGSIISLAERIFCSAAGYRLINVGKWHYLSPLYPQDVDALFTDKLEHFIKENNSCILIQPLSESTQNAIRECKPIETEEVDTDFALDYWNFAHLQ